MNKKLICLLAFAFSLCLGFTACGDDDDDPVNPVELKLDKTTVSVEAGKTVEVKVTQGNGTYSATPVATATATAEVKNDVITITGVAVGETDVVVKDKDNKSATVKVTVTAASETDYAEEIAGTYEGELTVLGNKSDESITLDRTAENKVKVSLKDFNFAGQNLGDIIVDEIVVSKEDGVYGLAETTATVEVTVGGVKISAKATVSGSVEDGTLNLTIEVTEIPDLNAITVTFEGTIPTEG
ncbi:MAG: calycin-like domain-containing protein [Dysgonomonas sp.]